MQYKIINKKTKKVIILGGRRMTFRLYKTMMDYIRKLKADYTMPEMEWKFE